MALSGAFNQSTYGWPQRESPEVLRNNQYAESAFFSGAAADFSAVGTSALLDDLSGVEGYHYIIWGWQSVYIRNTGSSFKHVTLEMKDDTGKGEGLIHGVSNNVTNTMLPQPLRFPTGSAVNYEVIESSIDGSDTVYGEVYYSLIKHVDGS